MASLFKVNTFFRLFHGVKPGFKKGLMSEAFKVEMSLLLHDHLNFDVHSGWK